MPNLAVFSMILARKKCNGCHVSWHQPLTAFRKSILDEDKNMEDFIELFDSRSSFATHIVFVNNDELPE